MIKQKQKFLFKALALFCALVMLTGLFSGCVIGPCEHEWVRGVCTVCHEQCKHEEYENGVCKECGMACEHKEYEFGVCKTCGTECKHAAYADGKCKECGLDCKHPSYVDGRCATCGTACKHDEFQAGVCKVCGYECKHEKYENGKCKVCGSYCKHNYVNNVCINCGAKKFVDNDKPEADYSYQAHISKTMPCIYVQSDTFIQDATAYVPSFDNNNPDNNREWQYHDCTVTVNNCEDAYALTDITAGIKVRGNWTTTYPKKPFRIKFDKKQAMLGLNDGAKCKSWVLLADYKDCSLERNSAAYYLGQKILGSDGYYCTDFRQVELYLNNQYWGVYLLAEQQQVNENRIDITEPEKDYTGTDIGYFVEYDGYYKLEAYGEWFESKHGQGYTIKSDVYEDARYPEYPAQGSDKRYPQKKFIQSYINNVYTICNDAVRKQYKTFNSDYTGLVTYKPTSSQPVMETVSKVVDIQSLVDMFIHCEIACDADIGWSSFFMDVDFGPQAKDHLLRFEAPWDFDSSLGFKVYEVADGTSIYAASRNPWLSLFMNENWFMTKVKNKWHEVYDAGVQEETLQLVLTMRNNYSDAYERNFKKWGFSVNGEATWEVRENVKNHSDATKQLYNWMTARFDYLNSIWL